MDHGEFDKRVNQLVARCDFLDDENQSPLTPELPGAYALALHQAQKLEEEVVKAGETKDFQPQLGLIYRHVQMLLFRVTASTLQLDQQKMDATAALRSAYSLRALEDSYALLEHLRGLHERATEHLTDGIQFAFFNGAHVSLVEDIMTVITQYENDFAARRFDVQHAKGVAIYTELRERRLAAAQPTAKKIAPEPQKMEEETVAADSEDEEEKEKALFGI
jgi:hypothetical protein